ncbi:hypothetical protein F4777DRAFT_119352 [Nemania sp. FL0916]|nr:hypothetical protein F4777DRAFT_119352 [Nemania sp. FL0916]
MTEHSPKTHVERCRHERRVQLATLARDRHADMSVVLGLSWRLQGHQAHIDYTGGLDTARLRRNIAAWGRSWSSALSPIAAARTGHDVKTPAERPTARARLRLDSGQDHGPEVESQRDALVRAAPVDFQYRASRRGPGETAEAHQARLLVHHERQTRDFVAVLARVDTAAVASLARDLLEEHRRRQSPAHARDPVPLPRVADPFFGSGHVFYVVHFRDGGPREKGVRWVMKIPAAGADGNWDELCRETLRGEAFLLHMLRMKTTIPVPEVIDADTKDGNEVGVPWLLMDFIRGRRLEDVWFGADGEGSGKMQMHALQRKREKILKNVAAAMLQLGQFGFDQGGAPCFDRMNGELVGAGPLRERDVQAMVDRWFLDEECDSTPLYRGVGPWDHVEEMYTALLDAYPPASVPERGVDELLRLLLRLVREPDTSRGEGEGDASPVSPPVSPPGFPRMMAQTDRARIAGKAKMTKFVLTHADVSMHHILLTEDGTEIKAILGWDGARAAPRSLGNEALPRWLVRDFDPFVWRWKPAADFWRVGHVSPEGNRFEDPPWVLRELRAYYARVVRELKVGGRQDAQAELGTMDGDSIRSGQDRHAKAVDVEVDMTRQSLLALTLDAAIRDPRRRTAALRRVMERCSRSFEPLDFDYFVDTLGEGYRMDPFRLTCLANNVRELVERGFVRSAAVR